MSVTTSSQVSSSKDSQVNPSVFAYEGPRDMYFTGYGRMNHKMSFQRKQPAFQLTELKPVDVRNKRKFDDKRCIDPIKLEMYTVEVEVIETGHFVSGKLEDKNGIKEIKGYYIQQGEFKNSKMHGFGTMTYDSATGVGKKDGDTKNGDVEIKGNSGLYENDCPVEVEGWWFDYQENVWSCGFFSDGNFELKGNGKK